jgi:hypothetical protein
MRRQGYTKPAGVAGSSPHLRRCLGCVPRLELTYKFRRHSESVVAALPNRFHWRRLAGTTDTDEGERRRRAAAKEDYVKTPTLGRLPWKGSCSQTIPMLSSRTGQAAFVDLCGERERVPRCMREMLMLYIPSLGSRNAQHIGPTALPGRRGLAHCAHTLIERSVV